MKKYYTHEFFVAFIREHYSVSLHAIKGIKENDLLVAEYMAIYYNTTEKYNSAQCRLFAARELATYTDMEFAERLFYVVRRAPLNREFLVSFGCKDDALDTLRLLVRLLEHFTSEKAPENLTLGEQIMQLWGKPTPLTVEIIDLYPSLPGDSILKKAAKYELSSVFCYLEGYFFYFKINLHTDDYFFTNFWDSITDIDMNDQTAVASYLALSYTDEELLALKQRPMKLSDYI